MDRYSHTSLKLSLKLLTLDSLKSSRDCQEFGSIFILVPKRIKRFTSTQRALISVKFLQNFCETFAKGLCDFCEKFFEKFAKGLWRRNLLLRRRLDSRSKIMIDGSFGNERWIPFPIRPSLRKWSACPDFGMIEFDATFEFLVKIAEVWHELNLPSCLGLSINFKRYPSQARRITGFVGDIRFLIRENVKALLISILRGGEEAMVRETVDAVDLSLDFVAFVECVKGKMSSQLFQLFHRRKSFLLSEK